MKKQKNAPHILPREEWPYEVPENWVWTRLENVLESVKEKTDSFNASLKYVGLENIEKDTGTIDFQFADEVKSTKTIFGQGNILYGRLRPYLNKHGLVPFDGICSTDILVFNSKEISLNQFVDYYFHLPIFIEYTVANSKGINLPRVTESTVLDAKFPLPPRPEQQRIVARIESLFSKLDAAAEKIRAALDTFPIRKAALLHKAFTGELTKKWREEHGVGMDSWKHETLCKTDLKIIDGDRGKNYPKREELSDTGYCLFLNAKNVTKNGFSFNDVQFISSEKNSLLRAGKLERGDIVLTTRGTIGNIAYYDESIPYHNVRINSGMVIYRGGTQFEKPFLIWFFKSEDLSRQIANLKTGTAQPQLPIKIMNNLLLPIPPIDEQQEIVRRLDAILAREQTAKETAERLLDTIALTKKSILARAFRGLLGTNDPKEESAEGLLKYSYHKEVS